MPQTDGDTTDVPDTPDGWTGPRDHLEAGERWHTGGGIYLRTAVHPEKELKVVWNPNHDPVEVGVERVKRIEEYGMWEPVERLESEEYDSDEAALAALPDILRRVEDEYAE